MYGAVLRPHTELVDSGQAYMGVLFLTNEGYSTMCGHATIAVSRMLVDHIGSKSNLFPIASQTHPVFDLENKQIQLKLHVPCGLVVVTVPVITDSRGGFATDTTRKISYLSVPSYIPGIGVEIPIPPTLRWPELGERDHIKADLTFGGAFYIITPASNLGFPHGLAHPDIRALSDATKSLKAAFNASEDLRTRYLYHPDHSDLQFLYSTIVTDTSLGSCSPGTSQAETGLCFFANQQIDRSPTGSGVQARIALAFAKGQLQLGESRTYHSLVSNAYQGQGAFVGQVVEEVDLGFTLASGGSTGVIVKVSGQAAYTGCCNFVIEEGDEIGKGFWFDELHAA